MLIYADDCDFVTLTEAELQLRMVCFSAAFDEVELTISLIKRASVSYD